MKFSEIAREEWEALVPYLDTCLLPITGLTGKQSPWQATKALEELGGLMEGLETAYKGRIVTYPAIHYASLSDSFAEHVNAICRNLKQTGFRHVFLISASPLMEETEFRDADLLLTSATAAKGRDHIRSLVEGKWNQLEEASGE